MCSTYLPVPGLFRLAYWFLLSHMLSQVTGFHSFDGQIAYILSLFASCFLFLAVVTSAALRGVRQFHWFAVFTSFGSGPSSGLVDHRDILSVLTDCLAGIVMVCFCSYLQTGREGALLSSPSVAIFCPFDNSLSDWSEMVSPCGFDLHFCDGWWYGAF